MSDVAQPERPASESPPLKESWSLLGEEERLQAFNALSAEEAEETFLSLTSQEQADLVCLLPEQQRHPLLRTLAPDDAVDLIQSAPRERHGELIAHFDRLTRMEVAALLAYKEDEAGGLMSTRYARIRPEMTVNEAFSYIRRQARRALATMSYLYVLDEGQRLLGVLSLRELFLAEPSRRIEEIMHREVLAVSESMNQEAVAQLLTEHKLVALPVIDSDRQLQGIITLDDVVDVVKEEATEDIQKLGGTEAVATPYFDTPFAEVIRSRARWLALLFVGEMFTASAMAHYEEEIERAVVLALFIPLIISSGGNSGSQSSTLIVRALALGEVRSKNWVPVLARETSAGLLLGLILGIIGFARILLWPDAATVYGEHYLMIGCAVAISVVGVVLWGTVAGAMVPLILTRAGLDPASSSTPFIATLVDITGITIYFFVARLFLTGLLL